MRKNYSSILIAFLTTAFLGFLTYSYLQSPQYLPFNSGEDEEKGLNEQEELLARMQHEKLMTMDPALGYVPIERLAVAEEQARLMMSSKENSPQALLSWTERGPSNMGGRSRAVLISKSDGTGNTVFIGSVGGGLWKTTNFKSATPTWTQVTGFSENLAITALVQDPTSLNVMYAGTGEGFGNTDAIRGLGIYKSTNGGTSWSLLSLPASGAITTVTQSDVNFIQDLAVYSDGSVYAAAGSQFCNRGGILKSTDGGTTWTRVLGNYVNPPGGCNNAFDFQGYDLEISLSGDIYATVTNYNGGGGGKIYKSPAGATVGNSGTWTNVAPAAKPGGFWQRIDVACAPNNNNIVYALFQGNGNAIDSIMRSDDAGGSWNNVDVTTNWCDAGSSTSLDFSRGQAWYDLIIAVKPDDAATAFAGGVDVMKTTNSGGAWAQITQWSSGCNTPTTLPNIHADIHNIVFFPTGLGTSNEFIVVNDGGIYYSSDGGTSFTNKSAGYNTIQYYALAMNPTASSNYMLAGAQDNGTHKFNTAGLGSVTTATGGDGAFCAIDSNNTNTQITGFTYANWGFSGDGGTNFSSLGFGQVGRFINPFDWDNASNYLYCCYNARQIARLNNVPAGPVTFQSVNVASTTNYMASALKVDPNTTNRVWVAMSTRPGVASQVPELYRIDGADNLPTATITGVNEPAVAAGSYLSSIDVESGNANHLLITFSNYGVVSVWESTDAGVNWTSVEGNLPDMPIRWAIFTPGGFDPGGPLSNAPAGAMLATELGVWTTQQLNAGSTTWTQNAGAMGNVRVDMVEIRRSDKTAAAATHGRGLFTTQAVNLPVNFTAFTGKAEEKQNRLFWDVENEVNNKGYEIERRYKHEQGFTKIGFVQAKSANASKNSYTFPDAFVDLGIENVSYRLKQIDIDGRFTYSAVVNLTRKASPKFVEYITVRPNSLLIRMSGQNGSNQLINFRLFDNSGRLLQQKQLQLQTQEVSMVGLPHGVFVVELSATDGRRHTQKIAY